MILTWQIIEKLVISLDQCKIHDFEMDNHKKNNYFIRPEPKVRILGRQIIKKQIISWDQCKKHHPIHPQVSFKTSTHGPGPQAPAPGVWSIFGGANWWSTMCNHIFNWFLIGKSSNFIWIQPGAIEAIL